LNATNEDLLKPAGCDQARRSLDTSDDHDLTGQEPPPMILDPSGNGSGLASPKLARYATRDPNLYINRELSWLRFDERVLEEARDETVKPLERLRFLAISASNLDEFFEVRVAGLQDQVYSKLEPQDPPPDGMGPQATLVEVARFAHDFVERQYEVWREEIRPLLEKHGLILADPADLTPEESHFLDDYFHSQVFPVLTPLAIDPAHPFPHIHNKSLNLILRIEAIGGHHQVRQLHAIVQVPSVLNRLVELPRRDDGKLRFTLLEYVIGPRLDSLFGGFHVASWASFRVTRNSDLSIQENEVKTDLLSMIRDNLRMRKWGDAVRLEIHHTAEPALVEILRSALDLDERDIYPIHGPLALSAMAKLCDVEGFRELKAPSFEPRMPAEFAKPGKILAAIRERDLLVHHPYESFGSVVRFIEEAADDPQVLAIKQTLYRTSDDNPIINALARAAENGKQVTALVELQARLDEENNIVKARALQKAGVHVVYGIVGLKTHCKAALVVRREADGIRRYLHLSTGNYNPTTARIYTDISFFTSRPEFGDDASALFNLLTGYSHGHEWQKFMVAPMNMADRIIELIERERDHAENGSPARIIAKMNALVEPAAIEALYDASRAGVKIDLIIRGICCLRPGIPGVSENIRVISIVDQFLEHSRIAYFHNNGNSEVYLASADWMPRNFRRRVEIMYPVESPLLKTRLIDEILEISLADNVKARELGPNGEYTRVRPPAEGGKVVRSQMEFLRIAQEVSDADPLRQVTKQTILTI